MIFFLAFFNPPCYSADDYQVTPQSTVTTLTVNNKINLDYEVYINKDGSISLPFKTTAKLFEIQTEQNHLTKEIKFTQNSGVTGIIDLQNQKIILGDKTINTKLVFLKSGIMSDTIDEIFIPAKDLAQIIDSEIIPDQNDYSVAMKTEKQLKALIIYDQENNQKYENPFKTYSEDNSNLPFVKPEKKFFITIDTLAFEDHTNYNNSIDGVLAQSLFYSSSKLKLKGSLYDGNYEITSGFNQNQNSMPLSQGIKFKYTKYSQNHKLELGDLSDSTSLDSSVGNGVMGIRFGKISKNIDNYRNIDGYVKPDSKINIYINNKLVSTLNTHDGYYSLSELNNINEKIRKLRIEQVSPDGSKKTVREEDYPFSKGLLGAGQSDYSAMIGISGFDNGLFANNYINNTLSKKLAGGLQYSKGLSDKLTLTANVTADHIISLPGQNLLLNNLPGSQNVMSLLLSDYRDFNPVEGSTAMVNLDYVPRDNLSLSAQIGSSIAKSVLNNPNYNIKPFGYGAGVSAAYKKNWYDLSGKLYDYSPDFYVAGSSGYGSCATILNDKLGAGIGANLDLKYIFINSSYDRYLSNLDNRLTGGKFGFNNYSISVRVPFNDGSRLDLDYTGRIGSNSIGKLIDKTSNISYEKNLRDDLKLNMSRQTYEYDNNFSGGSGNSYSSVFKDYLVSLDYTLPKNIGLFGLAHEIAQINSGGNNTNSYNAIRFTYTPPTFWRIATSLSYGIHYLGIDRGFDFSATLGYIFPSGRKLEICYSYNRVLGSLLDNIFLPASSRHSLTFNLADVFAFMGGIKSIGTDNNNSGFVQATAFLDLNQNGIRDKDEPLIPNIAVNFEGTGKTFQTDKNGKCMVSGIPDGMRKVKLDLDQLPNLLSLSPGSHEEYLVKVDNKKQSKVYFGLISSAGNVSGKINIQDQYGRKNGIDNLIISVFNIRGEEVKYTSVDKDGNYSISGLSPGKYIVKLDKGFIDAYKLSSKESAEKIIDIPPVYDNYVDIKNVNFNFIQEI